jgi:ATP-dependent protease Clp ATPase subunit
MITPNSINEFLDINIFGQEEAKKTMSLAFYMHLMRNGLLENKIKNNYLHKPNVLMLGNPGSGKTLMIHNLCSKFQLPNIKIDGGIFLTTPNIGEMLDAYLRYLVLQFGAEKASTAVICIDGFDELCNRQQIQPNISVSIQQDLLQMIEQKERMLVIEQGKEPIMFPLDNLMFIFSGRFPGIESLIFMRAKITDTNDEIVKRKEERLALVGQFKLLKKEDPKADKLVERIGFKTQGDGRTDSEMALLTRKIQSMYDELKENELEQLVEQAYQKEMLHAMNEHLVSDKTLLQQVGFHDLINYGVLPEFAARFSLIATLDKLDAEDIIAIIKKTENNIIEQFKTYFDLHDDKIDFKEEVYKLIAYEVVERGVGTRSIHSIFIQLLQGVLYDSPNDKKEKFVIDANYFAKHINSKII